MRRLLIILLAAAAAYVAWEQHEPAGVLVAVDRGSNAAIARAFQERTSGIQVSGKGVVTKILADDDDGSRHQRFIIELPSGQTLLVAHNIDLAPRIAALREGDVVEFNGVYEWNAKGGVIHWTHHDPQGRHEAGWLRHHGRIYQ